MEEGIGEKIVYFGPDGVLIFAAHFYLLKVDIDLHYDLVMRILCYSVLPILMKVVSLPSSAAVKGSYIVSIETE